MLRPRLLGRPPSPSARKNRHARPATARSGSEPHHRSLGSRRVWVGARATVLAGHLSNSLIRETRNSPSTFAPRYQQKYQQNDRQQRRFRELLIMFSNGPPQFS